MKKARGGEKHLLRVISDLQSMIGSGIGHHDNDRDMMGFEKAQRTLQAAFELCIKTTGEYDPASYDPYYKQERDK